MILTPNPTSTRGLQWRCAEDGTSYASTEMSEVGGFGRVYDDAVDLGLTLVSHRTGRQVTLVVTDEVRDDEGDILYWVLAPAKLGAPFVQLTVYND